MHTPILPTHACDPAYIECPHCGQLVRRFTAGAGVSYRQCESRVRDLRAGEVRRCNGHMMIVGHAEGFASVLKITADEYEVLGVAPHEAPRDALRRLHMLRTNDRRPIPLMACRRCRAERPAFDLFDGECSRCVKRHGPMTAALRTDPAAAGVA